MEQSTTSPWGPQDGPMRPARLSVGVISAGRVGTALGVALERAEHVVAACSAISDASRQRAARRLPDTAVLPVDEVARRAELLLLAVPDAELTSVVAGLAATGSVRPGTIVAHTSGANGIAVLRPLTEQDCIPLAIHPAMTTRTSRGWPTPASGSPPPTMSATPLRSRWCSRSAASRSGFGRTPARCTTPPSRMRATTS